MSANGPGDPNERMAAAINAGDVDAALATYEPGACLVGAPGEPAVGHDAIRAVLQSLVDAKATISMDTGTLLEVGDLAMCSHAWKATGEGPDGPIELSGNAVEVVRRQADGTWLFVIDDPYGGAPAGA